MNRRRREDNSRQTSVLQHKQKSQHKAPICFKRGHHKFPLKSDTETKVSMNGHMKLGQIKYSVVIRASLQDLHGALHNGFIQHNII